MNKNIKSLSPITNPLNSILVEKRFKNIDQKFIDIIKIANNLPRTTVIESSTNYWHGVCRSFIFRFPDDLEILNFKSENYLDKCEGVIQIRSASRFGQSDLGVNKRRVQRLLFELQKNS